MTTMRKRNAVKIRRTSVDQPRRVRVVEPDVLPDGRARETSHTFTVGNYGDESDYRKITKYCDCGGRTVLVEYEDRGESRVFVYECTGEIASLETGEMVPCLKQQHQTRPGGNPVMVEEFAKQQERSRAGQAPEDGEDEAKAA